MRGIDQTWLGRLSDQIDKQQTETVRKRFGRLDRFNDAIGDQHFAKAATPSPLPLQHPSNRIARKQPASGKPLCHGRRDKASLSLGCRGFAQRRRRRAICDQAGRTYAK